MSYLVLFAWFYSLMSFGFGLLLTWFLDFLVAFRFHFSECDSDLYQRSHDKVRIEVIAVKCHDRMGPTYSPGILWSGVGMVI